MITLITPNAVLCALIAYSNPTPLQQAIKHVETDITNNSPFTVGDNGKSLGCYQIQKAYWTDSKIGLPYLPWVYSPALSELVMTKYWKRYGAISNEAKARIHNGGPRGMTKQSTKSYWNKVKRRLRK